MGCSLIVNFHFQMGVCVMGFAEHFGHYHGILEKPMKWSLQQDYRLGFSPKRVKIKDLKRCLS